ncbi:MAG: thioredoxin family protein [Actinomycetes bacterium]
MAGVWVVVAVLVLSTAFGLAHRARAGRFRARRRDADRRDAVDLRPVVVGLGEEPGERATLLQFSSAFCAPCRATRRILHDVAALVPGVKHVEVDAEQHFDLVRRLDISKTPTTLVLGADGRVTARAVGQPRKAEVLAAVGNAVP